ncbi:hypothetical protein PR048_001120 [Dryococelus australis]|uniref:Uncharacterized protein n=1 Tax=Dryococelus australis TaxID=614101 RepID=A0ABQ9IGK2_9NEOP|nr:hypothetical protein PR048_001120 [Dryococelus australis]
MCIRFGHCEGGTNNVKLCKLVDTPIITYKAVETLKHHASTDYHKGNMIASHNFLMVMDGKYDDVILTGKKVIEENMKTYPYNQNSYILWSTKHTTKWT